LYAYHNGVGQLEICERFIRETFAGAHRVNNLHRSEVLSESMKQFNQVNQTQREIK
jgi:hypothetical protein